MHESIYELKLVSQRSVHSSYLRNECFRPQASKILDIIIEVILNHQNETKVQS
jgi:hypothetical protein